MQNQGECKKHRSGITGHGLQVHLHLWGLCPPVTHSVCQSSDGQPVDHACARILPQVRVQKSMDNLNTKQDVERIRRDVLENLRQLSFAPGASAVQHLQCDTILWHFLT